MRIRATVESGIGSEEVGENDVPSPGPIYRETRFERDLRFFVMSQTMRTMNTE